MTHYWKISVKNYEKHLVKIGVPLDNSSALFNNDNIKKSNLKHIFIYHFNNYSKDWWGWNHNRLNDPGEKFMGTLDDKIERKNKLLKIKEILNERN